MSRDLDDQVTDLFPLNGPYSTDQTLAAARSIAALVRYLNHATPPWKQPAALEYPSHLASVIANLGAALSGMQQLVGQLAHYADMFGTNPGLYDDRGDDPVNTVRMVVGGLKQAIGKLEEPAAALRYAHTAADRLGIRE